MGEHVHFRGKDAIVQAYSRNNVPGCILCSAKDILFQYDGDDVEEGADMLGQFIDALKKGHSQAVYQLRMYKDPPANVNLKTDWNYSFKCRILDEDEVTENGGSYNTSRETYKRLDALTAELAELKRERELEQEEEGEEVGGFQSVIGGLINRPDVQNFLIQKMMGFMNNLTGNKGQPAQPGAAVSGLPGAAAQPMAAEGLQQEINTDTAYNRLAPDQRQLLDQAMAVLMERDPNIGTNLYKLAKILYSDPDRYNNLAKMI